jgi:hypothetical protein
MLVQYVVGLCCLRANPDAVDVTVGDLVLDSAAQKRRDVDVTVTLENPDQSVSAFKAYEVKDERKAIDVATVEQLCIKLNDMKNVTHRYIVSTSNFTDGAINKANAHNVYLYIVKSWTKRIDEQFPDFPNIGTPDQFFSSFKSNLLTWNNYETNIIVPTATTRFSVTPTDRIFNSNGKPHRSYENWGKFIDVILLRSTELLLPLEPARTVMRAFPYLPIPGNNEFEATPAWPHTHTLQVGEEKVCLMLEGRLQTVHSITISGQLEWRRRKLTPQFYIMEGVPNSTVFAGAAIAEWGSDDGKMSAIIFPSESRTLGIHNFQLTETQRKIIRNLKIPLAR